jgi:hypothetical protein
MLPAITSLKIDHAPLLQGDGRGAAGSEQPSCAPLPEPHFKAWNRLVSVRDRSRDRRPVIDRLNKVIHADL